MQTLAANCRQVDLVKHRMKQVVPPAGLTRHLLEDADDVLARWPLHHDHGVVVITEFRDVVDPQLVVFAFRIEQIDAAYLVAEVLGGIDAAGNRQQDRHQRDHCGHP